MTRSLEHLGILLFLSGQQLKSGASQILFVFGSSFLNDFFVIRYRFLLFEFLLSITFGAKEEYLASFRPCIMY